MSDFLLTLFVLISGATVFLGAAAFILFAALFGMVWRAWWLYPAWSWFLEPLGLPPISFWHFVALSMVLGIFTHEVDLRKDDRKNDWTNIGGVFCAPVIAWAILRWMR